MNGLFFTDKINECLDSKAFIAHIAPVSDELDLFTKLSNALHFPDYFGKNWDALIDLYYDFHWILEKDIIIFHESLSGLSEQELKTYLQIVFIAWVYGAMKKCIEFLLSSLVKMKIKYYASFLTILRQLLNYR